MPGFGVGSTLSLDIRDIKGKVHNQWKIWGDNSNYFILLQYGSDSEGTFSSPDADLEAEKGDEYVTIKNVYSENKNRVGEVIASRSFVNEHAHALGWGGRSNKKSRKSMRKKSRKSMSKKRRKSIRRSRH